MIWQRCENFSYKSLYSSFSIESLEAFPSSMIWNPWVLVKVGLKAWEATCGRIFTLD